MYQFRSPRSGTAEQPAADYNPEIGNAVPMRVFHGIVRWWSIPCLA